MISRRTVRLAALVLFSAVSSHALAATADKTESNEAWNAATQPRPDGSGEQVPSDDPAVWDFHSLGLVRGSLNLFRSAAPLRDLEKQKLAPASPTVVAEANARMKRLHALGIRTIISFEALELPDKSFVDMKDQSPTSTASEWVRLERDSAEAHGIRFIAWPIANRGPQSLETMSDRQVKKVLDDAAAAILNDAAAGGVLFHCSAGHDRTGIVTAYIRMKYQRWSVDQAIAEMRRFGHNWPKYSHNAGESSWDEDHLKAIARLLTSPNP